MSTTVKRACDPCHRRKVRCNGVHPCRNCSQAALVCTYNAIPQKKGPKGSRAKVISELRETQKQSELALKLHNRLSAYEFRPPSPTFARTPGLLSPDVIDTCVDFFFEHMYPTMPILHRSRLQHMILSIDSSIETYCLVTALCAFMMIQPGVKVPASHVAPGDLVATANFVTGTTLLSEVLRVRKGYDYIETPTVTTVITSFFLFGCYFGLDKHNTAWYHLREATTLTLLLGMQQESSYISGDPIENSMKRRLFWFLFVTERAYALQRRRPLTLHATIKLPTLDEDPADASAIPGFLHLVNLYRPFDEAFVGVWNKTRRACSPAWLALLQRQLADALPSYLNSTENQAADLKVSQEWLRTMVWQLSMAHGNLSSTSADASMTFRYPIEISRDLLAATGTFSQQSMEVHGVGLIEKLFDVACTLIDVMACVPLETGSLEVGPSHYLTQFISLISSLRGGDSRYLPLLQAKIDDALPAMAAPVAHSLPLRPPHDRILESYESSASSSSTPYGSPPVPSSAGLEYSDLTSGMSDIGITNGAPFTSATSGASYLTSSPLTAAMPLYQAMDGNDFPG